MPRTKRQPAYRRHQARELAVVTIHGKDIYLGPYDSPECHEMYARLCAGWKPEKSSAAINGHAPSPTPKSVNAVILPYLEFAATYYMKDVKPTGEIGNPRDDMTAVKRLSQCHCSHDLSFYRFVSRPLFVYPYHGNGPEKTGVMPESIRPQNPRLLA